MIKDMKHANDKGNFWCEAGAQPTTIGVWKALARNTLRNLVMKAVKRAGMGDMTTNEEGGSPEKPDKLAAHFLRGHGGSVLHVLHSSEFAMWSVTEHLDRARHLQSTFDKNYSRGVVNRVRIAFRKHTHRSLLTPEEALIL